MIDDFINPTAICEDALILENKNLGAGFWHLRFRNFFVAKNARPGQFVQIRCHPNLLQRRPFSLFGTDPETGEVDIWYKVVGEGTRLLSGQKIGEQLSVLGPLGQGFESLSDRPNALLIGGGVGVPPLIFFAKILKNKKQGSPVLFMGSGTDFPFVAGQHQDQNQIIFSNFSNLSASMPLLDQWGIPNALAHAPESKLGCFHGFVTDLADVFLAQQSAVELKKWAMYACGPEGLLRETVRLAQHYDLPSFLSLEAFMACGVGGCAGCTLPIIGPQGITMKKVCVDGPVFKGHEVIFSA